MSSYIRVSLAVNDGDNGMPQGWVGAVDVGDIGEDLMLESPVWNGGPTFSRVDDNRIRVGRFVYPIIGYGFHVGNWCWDAVTMELEQARRLVRNLLAWGFQATRWCESAPILEGINLQDECRCPDAPCD